MKKDVSRVTRRPRKRIALITGAVVAGVVALTSGFAIANWSASSTGSASSKAVTAQGLTITAVASPTAELYPGFIGALHFTVTNPNPYPVSLSGWSTGTISSSDSTNCPVIAANITVTASGTLGTPIAVAASATSAAQSIPASITMTSTAANGCQGVLFTVALTITGTQT